MKFNFKTLCTCLALVTYFGSAVAEESDLPFYKGKGTQSTAHYTMTDSELDQWIAAAINGDIDVIKSFLHKGVNVDQTRPGKSTALWHAAATCRTDIMRLLIDNGANVNYCGNKSVLAVFVDCAYWDSWNKNVLDLLLKKGTDPNKYDKSNSLSQTPLMTIAECFFSNKDPNRALEIIRKLLNHGAKINLEDYWGRTALDYAEESKNKDIIDFLKNNGAQYGSRQKYGSTGSNSQQRSNNGSGNRSNRWSSDSSSDDLVSSSDSHAEFDDSDEQKSKQYNEVEHQQSEKKKMTQEVYDELVMAVNRGDIDTVRAYIKENYDINPPIRNGMGTEVTVLEEAAISNAKNSCDVMRLLLENGANPDRPGAVFQPLAVAIRKHSLDKVKLLWEFGANVNNVDDNGWLPLNLAVSTINNSPNEEEKAKCRAIVKFLLMSTRKDLNSEVLDLLLSGKHKFQREKEWISKKSASIDPMRTNINGQNKDGRTALMIAVNNGEIETVKLLLQYGASLDIKDRYGDTALDLAKYRITYNQHKQPVKPESAEIAREILKILQNEKAKRKAQQKIKNNN